MQYKIEKNSLEYQLLTAWWKFRQLYYNPKTDEDFQKLIIAVDEFVDSFKGTDVERFARTLAIVHAEDCEIRSKERERERKGG